MIYKINIEGRCRSYVSTLKKPDGKLYSIRMLMDSNQNVFVVAEDILRALGCCLQYRNVALHCVYNKLDLTQLGGIVGIVGVPVIKCSSPIYYFSWEQLQQVQARYKYNPSLAQLLQHILQDCKTVLNRK